MNYANLQNIKFDVWYVHTYNKGDTFHESEKEYLQLDTASSQ